jgi:hypothetical protein
VCAEHYKDQRDTLQPFADHARRAASGAGQRHHARRPSGLPPPPSPAPAPDSASGRYCANSGSCAFMYPAGPYRVIVDCCF